MQPQCISVCAELPVSQIRAETARARPTDVERPHLRRIIVLHHLSPQKFYGPWSQVSCREFRDNIPVAGIHVPCAVVQSKELSAGHSYFARSVSKPTSSSQSYFVRRDAVSNRTEDPKCASVAPHCPPTPHVL